MFDTDASPRQQLEPVRKVYTSNIKNRKQTLNQTKSELAMGKLDVLNQDGHSSLDESQYRNLSMKKYNSTFNIKKRSEHKKTLGERNMTAF